MQIEEMLQAKQIAYETLRHKPVTTSAEAAAVRGVPLSSGAKALICKCDKELVLFVMPADRRLAGKAVRRQAGYKKLRFASPEEVWELTGLRPGAIPPFGSLFGLSTFCDPALGENERINFNAGDHAVSISMRYADYIAAEQPNLFTCAEIAP
jgi:Ala-tRNA(Pro) deacylase